ncbi:hypothetical protein JCM10213_000693 [Rhodosporidiobolus nylandii]
MYANDRSYHARLPPSSHNPPLGAPRPSRRQRQEDHLRRLYPDGCVIVGGSGGRVIPPSHTSSGGGYGDFSRGGGGGGSFGAPPPSAGPPLHWAASLASAQDGGRAPQPPDEGRKRARLPEDEADAEMRGVSGALGSGGAAGGGKRPKRARYAPNEAWQAGEASGAGGENGSQEVASASSGGAVLAGGLPVESNGQAAPQTALYLFPLPLTLSRAKVLSLVAPFYPSALKVVSLTSLLPPGHDNLASGSAGRTGAVRVVLPVEEAKKLVERGRKGEVLHEGERVCVEPETDEVAKDAAEAVGAPQEGGEGSASSGGGLGRSEDGVNDSTVANPSTTSPLPFTLPQVSQTPPSRLPLTQRIASALVANKASIVGMAIDAAPSGASRRDSFTPSHGAPQLPAALGALPPSPTPDMPRDRHPPPFPAPATGVQTGGRLGGRKLLETEADERKMREVQEALKGIKAERRVVRKMGDMRIEGEVEVEGN